MPKPISDEELQFKVRARRRILGAVALVVALVVLLPMVLDSQPKRETKEIAINIPAQDKAPPFNPPLKPDTLVDKAAPAPIDVKPSPKGEPTNGVTKASPVEVKPLDKPADKPKAVELPKPAEGRKPAETVRHADPRSAKFAVQLGVFSNLENAQQVEARLTENNIRHYTETLKSPPGAIRVRAGPYPNRAEAESALTQLKLAGISGGVVVSE